MLEINVKDYRELSFEMELSGIASDKLEGRLRLIVDNIEYGIPAKITESEIVVNIPPLKRLIQRELDEGEKFPARLDVFGEGHYLKPWSGEFKVSNPVLVEAKIKEDSQPEIKVSVTEIGSKSTISEKKKVTKPKTRKPVKKFTESTAKRKTPLPPKKQPLFENKEDFKKNLTKDHVISWISKNATKNPQIQEMLYEQAAGQAGSSKPYKILVALTDVIKKSKYRS
jgi:hypothetical protein